jgi:hypothetical protein
MESVSMKQRFELTFSHQLLIVLQLLPLNVLPGATFERQTAIKRLCITRRGMALMQLFVHPLSKLMLNPLPPHLPPQ